MAQVTIEGPKALAFPSTMGGDDAVFGLVLVSASRGLTVKDLPNGKSRVSGITDLVRLAPAVPLLHAKGFQIYGYPVFFEFDSEAAMDAPVPESFPNRTFTTQASPEDEPVEHVHTFGSWGYPAALRAGKWYKSSQDAFSAPSGRPIPVSAWIGAGLTVITEADYQALPMPEAQ